MYKVKSIMNRAKYWDLVDIDDNGNPIETLELLDAVSCYRRYLPNMDTILTDACNNNDIQAVKSIFKLIKYDIVKYSILVIFENHYGETAEEIAIRMNNKYILEEFQKFHDMVSQYGLFALKSSDYKK